MHVSKLFVVYVMYEYDVLEFINPFLILFPDIDYDWIIWNNIFFF